MNSFLAFVTSLRWRLLGWFFLNVAVIVVGLLTFMRFEFGLGLDSLLGGSTGRRLQGIAVPLANELRRVEPSAWNDALNRAVGKYMESGRVRAAIVDDHATVLAGSLPPLPPDVRRALERVPPPPGPRPEGPPPRQPPPLTPAGDLGEFMLISADPRLYWVGVYLENVGPSAQPGPPRFAALVLASSSLSGGGLFFDYRRWLLLAAGLLAISIILWAPFLRRLTHVLTDMTRAAERISEGRFHPPRISNRDDELGRLSRALANMAARLEGYVTGQKRFLGDTAHELLSPLARLEVGLSILEQRSGEVDAPVVARALDEVRHLASIVQDLLLFTKSELRAAPVILQGVPLERLARTVARRETNENSAVQVDVEPALCALADRDLLDRALSNAVRNAVRYAGHAGPITIFAASSKHAPEEVRLTVYDQGPGAPESTLKQLFDPFFRPEAARTRESGGTGLGLAIVKSCVEACGGSVTASNRTGSGLAVTFCLNRAPDLPVTT